MRRVKRLLGAGLVTLLGAAGWAQVPDTATGRTARAPAAATDQQDHGAVPNGLRARIDSFFEAYNSGDAERMLGWYQDGATESFRSRRSDEQDRALYRRIHGDTGRLTARRLGMTPDGRVRAVLESSNLPEPVQFVFTLEPEAPYRIDGFAVTVGEPDPADSPLPPIELSRGADAATLSRTLDRYLGRLAGDGMFSGAVLVARDGKIVFLGAYGQADRASSLPNRPDTRFDVGSITKAFTKVAVGQLLRDGRLALDDTVLKHLPDYPNRDAAAKITVRHLLEHRSGLGDIFNERWDAAPKRSLRTPRDFFPLFADRPLLFEPGQGRQYSNAGYIVLGRIVEAASGMAYESYLQEKVFEPAGMKRSGFLPRDGSEPGLAVGYTRRRGDEGGEPRPNTDMLPIRGCPAGSSSHTAEDLLRFDRSLRSGKLLDGWTVWFFTGEPPGPADDKRPRPGRLDHPLGIAGGGPGVSAVLETDGSTAVIVLANADPPIAEDLGRRITGVIR